jgi:hypothetical protein
MIRRCPLPAALLSIAFARAAAAQAPAPSPAPAPQYPAYPSETPATLTRRDRGLRPRAAARS